MIRSLQIGQIRFDNNIIQGPLAGISCAPFRALLWQYSQPAYACTEMMSCQTINHAAPRFQHRYIKKDENEGPVCFQLAAQEADELAAAVRRVTDAGADLIDLNCGCPVKKIRRKGMGSRLLQDPIKLYQLITVMKQNTSLPVTVKIRVQGKSDECFHREVASAIAEAGADALIVHGRHWTEHYETACHYEDIQFFVENMAIPVIGNGDISDFVSLKKMFATGCQGVMIARAGVGQPWLINNLKSFWQGEPIFEPTLTERGQAFLTHVHGLMALLGEEVFAILQARTFAKYYARFLPFQHEWVQSVNRCVSLDDLVAITRHFFYS